MPKVVDYLDPNTQAQQNWLATWKDWRGAQKDLSRMDRNDAKAIRSGHADSLAYLSTAPSLARMQAEYDANMRYDPDKPQEVAANQRQEAMAVNSRDAGIAQMNNAFARLSQISDRKNTNRQNKINDLSAIQAAQAQAAGHTYAQKLVPTFWDKLRQGIGVASSIIGTAAGLPGAFGGFASMFGGGSGGGGGAMAQGFEGYDPTSGNF